MFTETDTGTPKDGPVEEPDRFVYGLSKEGITDALRSIAPDVKRCFERGIRDEDITGGKVMFNFKIEQRIDDPENVDIAQITEVGVKDSTIDSEGVEACVMQLIDELWFDPPDDGAIYIQYPIVFVDPEVE